MAKLAMVLLHGMQEGTLRCAGMFSQHSQRAVEQVPSKQTYSLGLDERRKEVVHIGSGGMLQIGVCLARNVDVFCVLANLSLFTALCCCRQIVVDRGHAFGSKANDFLQTL